MPAISVSATVYGLTEEEPHGDETRYYCVSGKWWFKMQTTHWYDYARDLDGHPTEEFYEGYNNWDIEIIEAPPEGLVDRRQGCWYDLQWDMKRTALDADTRTRFLNELRRHILKY